MAKNKSLTEKDLTGFQVTPTTTEKLYNIFLEKYRRVWDDAGSGMREHDIEEVWEDILREIKSVEHVRKFSTMAESVDYLLEKVNEAGWNRIAIRDPGHRDNFILVDRDFAEKALVLGSLP